MSTNTPTDSKKQAHAISKLEWAVSAIGALLFLALLTYLIYDVIQDEHQPPQLSVSIQSIQQTENGFLVQFQVYNAGDRTADSVTIAASLRDQTGLAETYTTTIDYVPPASHREGGFIFQQNPADFDLQIIPTGYQTP
ncbi:TIGR02588 family protein [Anaerolineales bacterium]